MMTKLLWSVALLVPVGLSAVAVGYSRDTANAEDVCPGKVECPLTGEEVCKDKCPLIDTNRADCPGKVECPLTGEEVCKDKCPLNADIINSKVTSDLPPCCQKK
ncbi:hypothetical protein MNBD_PLANCTO02-1904 [hydrothermal vent metagenome]|uniref:Uncharacterized protein n=1 Tax=hydrothermal vent metagenome TaxID=652676 RepID=A0A3B1DG02_9ZZZZ